MRGRTVEYTPQAYVPTDLDMFFSNFSSEQVGERPTLVSIDGGENCRCLSAYAHFEIPQISHTASPVIPSYGMLSDSFTGFVQSNQTGFDYNGEPNLDLEYAMSLVGPKQPVTLYQTGDDVEGILFAPIHYVCGINRHNRTQAPRSTTSSMPWMRLTAHMRAVMTRQRMESIQTLTEDMKVS